MWNEFPSADEIDRARFERERTRTKPARLKYIMYFTPRSGSSWVTEIAARSGHLGRPGECFNPNFLPQMARAMNATDMDEYCDILTRRRVTNGVFGSQITYHQLNAVFPGEADFIARFPEKKCFWLIREDIVLQGISLVKMLQTQIAHATKASDQELERKEQDFRYDATEIKRWITHIHKAETKTEALIARFELEPFRMSYERNTRLKPQRLANVMHAYLGLPRQTGLNRQSEHRKIGTDRNLEFAEQFRAEMPEFVAGLDAARQPMLDALRDYTPRTSACSATTTRVSNRSSW